jgi:hypothetical protein
VVWIGVSFDAHLVTTQPLGVAHAATAHPAAADLPVAVGAAVAALISHARPVLTPLAGRARLAAGTAVPEIRVQIDAAIIVCVTNRVAVSATVDSPVGTSLCISIPIIRLFVTSASGAASTWTGLPTGAAVIGVHREVDAGAAAVR